VDYAGFWIRFVAYIIDEILIGIVSLIVILPFLLMAGVSLATLDEYDPSPVAIFSFIGAYLAAIITALTIKWLYYAIMESNRGATLGKMALRLRVTDMAGNRVTFARATGRWFGKILSALPLSVGFMMAGWTQQKQALHDILASTLVVRE
jgi:uncharacterized RDD family membrane protein YckC